MDNDPTYLNVRRRLIAMGYSQHEAEYNAAKAAGWDHVNMPPPDLLAKGAEQQLKQKANEIFSDYKEKESKLAYAGGPLGKLIFDKINEESYNKIQNAIDTNPIGNWDILKNIDATKQTSIEILKGVPNQQGGLLDNPLTNIAASVGGTVKNVNKVADNAGIILDKTTKLVGDVTDPNSSIFPILLGGAGIVAVLYLLK